MRMWLDKEKLMINSGLQTRATDIERSFLVSQKHEDVFTCDNVEGDKAGDEREKQGGNAGARSANRQDRMEQKNQARKVWRRSCLHGKVHKKEQPKVVSLIGKKREICVHTAV